MTQLHLFDLLPQPSNMHSISTHTTWVPQNTGYTNGLSWFDTFAGYDHACKTREEAEVYNNNLKEQMGTQNILYRVVKRTITEEAFPQHYK